MVEPFLTVLIISCIVGGIGALLAVANFVINVSSTLRLQSMNAKQKKKYMKAKNAIVTKYTGSTPENYFKIACLLNIARGKTKKTGFISVTTERGPLTLSVSLQDIELIYQPYQSWYRCKCHFNAQDNSILCTFVDMKSRTRFDKYLEKDLNLQDLESICRGEKTLVEVNEENEDNSQNDENDKNGNDGNDRNGGSDNENNELDGLGQTTQERNSPWNTAWADENNNSNNNNEKTNRTTKRSVRKTNEREHVEL